MGTSKTIIITGANSGLRLECAKDIAKAGKEYQVILACRNKEKGQAARFKIIEETNNQNISVMELDTASLDSVRSFADEIKTSQ